ncbi:glutamate receptor ionotropic, kainate 1-like [Babylonia areolata]|uniref:glutamate receptor ionotropic, kainate 1-like n=1 Tax=Babylonia areolata TaxID=304850 RepID=UPI003FCF7C7E
MCSPLCGLVYLLAICLLCFVQGGDSSDGNVTNCYSRNWKVSSQDLITSGIPFIAKPCDNMCCLDEDRIMLLSWTCELAAILYDVIQHVHWSNVIFAYDYHNVRLQQVIVETLSTLYVGVVHVPIDAQGNGVNLTHLVAVLANPPNVTSTTPSAPRNIILYVTPGVVRTVLEQARTLGLLSRDYQWFILCPDQSTLTPIMATLGPDSNVLMLLWTSRNQGEGMMCCDAQLPGGDSNDLSSNDTATNGTQILPCNGTLSLLSYKSYPKQHFSNIDDWQIGRGWQKPLPGRFFSNVFQDFGNRLLIIGTIVSKPFVERKQIGNETVYEGFCIDMLRTMASFLKFRYIVVESPDNKYGAPEPDGRWNGMVGMVQREEVDMGVGPYTITSIRETVVDFSVPYMEDGGGIITMKGGSATSIMAGLETFSGAIWLCLLATTVSVGVGLYLSVRFSPNSDSNSSSGSGSGRSSDEWHLWACLLHICGSLMQQGMETHPKNVSARCLLGFWWVFSILVVSTFTATLASMLTVDVAGFQVDSIDDLLSSSFKPLVLSGSMWETLFMTAKSGVYSKVAERMTDMPEVTSEDMGLEHVMRGDTAFMHDVNSVQYMYAVNCKQLHLAASIFNSNGFGIIMRENAPYKDAVNDLILRLQEGGFLEKWRSRWWPMTNECETRATSVSQAEQLGLSKMTGLLVVYGSVMVLSVLCFLLTLFFYRLDLVERLASSLRAFLSGGKVLDRGGQRYVNGYGGGAAPGAAATTNTS